MLRDLSRIYRPSLLRKEKKADLELKAASLISLNVYKMLR